MTRKKSIYSPEFKTQAICLVRDANRSASDVAKELGINVNTLYNWLSPVTDKLQKKPTNDDILSENKRLKKELAQRGTKISRKRIARLMKLAGLACKTKRKFKVTTDSKHSLEISPNLLKRQFHIHKPNSLWAGDITYIQTRNGWLYLATVMDLYSRKIVGWAMDTSMKAALVNDALTMAIWSRKPGKGLIWHSDRGSQYCAKSHRTILKDHGVLQSMSRKGNRPDNATSESFFSTLKREMPQMNNFADQKQAAAAIFEYIGVFYNRIRAHSTIGYRAPAEFQNNPRIVEKCVR